MIRDGKPINHSGQGAGWGNAVLFAVLYVLFLGCLYAMGFWDFEQVWIPGLISLGLAVIVFIVPKNVVGITAIDEERIYAKQEVDTTRH